ncbi:shikimate kinase [Gryllotalpicola ginsengisoli]|uniref:shikimate kinase n=1 Tax=Gryllotalpicola ginsengisoli TaxID=444608 RepID=UPI0003B52AC3|nr:shikimate kinase [Gryllotalpicola ginsengisoli]
MPIVLIGPPASGKSRVGRRVAKLLGKTFIDTDALIVQRHGPIPEIFAQHGEAHFRRLERDAVVEALAQDAVVSFGGGAVLDPETQRDLASARVVMLDVTREAVEARLDAGRPLVKDLEGWAALVEARRPLYERLADVRIDTSRTPMTRVADDIVAWVHRTRELTE